MVLTAMFFGLAVAGLVVSVGLYFRNLSSRVRQRLAVAEGKPEGLLAREQQHTRVLPSGLVKKVEETLGLKRDSSKVKELAALLTRAGIYNNRALSIFLGLKLGLAVGLPILTLPLVLEYGRNLPKFLLLLAFYALVVAGYFLPTLVLRHLASSRQKKIKEGLPDALDLLVVCVEAGQGLNAALKRVAEELSLNSPALSRELLTVNLEINAGLEREQALRNLAERTGVEEIASLCSILVQSDRFGTSMAQALRVQSDTLRTTRRQKLEELAAKTPVKLVFPLLLFIFPALMVVIIGPAAIRIIENFK